MIGTSKMYTPLRTAFQILAFCIFIFQMQQALVKYFNKPKSYSMSSSSIEDIQQPLFYVCNENQFIYNKANEIGYAGMTDYLSGIVSGSVTPSWLGNSTDVNLTGETIRQSLYQFNYSDMSIGDVKQVYILPYGFCLQVFPESMSSLAFTAYHGVKFLILDPYQSTMFRLDEMHGKSTTLKKEEKVYEFSHFIASYEIYDDSINDGITCTDYNGLGSTFGECFQREVNLKMLEWMGCIPIWFPGNMSTCDLSLKNHSNDAYWFIRRLFNNKHIPTSCKASCTRMEVKLTKVFEIQNFPHFILMDVEHDEKVTVYTLTYSYDAFSLAVEIGSALGLWLGMSAIGILDVIIDIWRQAQKYGRQ